jgi:hypothetical protein
LCQRASVLVALPALYFFSTAPIWFDDLQVMKGYVAPSIVRPMAKHMKRPDNVEPPIFCHVQRGAFLARFVRLSDNERIGA